MVVKSRKVLQSDRRINDEDIVIDLGAPQSDLSAPRIQNYTQRGGVGRLRYPAAEPTFHNPLGKFEKEFKLGGTPSQTEKGGRRAKRRTVVSDLYIPNPRLYQSKPAGKKPAGAVNKRGQQSRARSQSPKRVTKRQKRKTRRLVPNPRLYQAPPKRAAYTTPPQCPQTGWLPAPDTAPQHTASQIALQFSEREKIPFRELLPAAIKEPVVQLCNSQLPPHPTPRDRIWEMVSSLSPKTPVQEKRPSFTLSTERPPPVREKKQKLKRNSNAKYKNGAPKERPGVHNHFLPKEGSARPIRYSSAIPTLDVTPTQSSTHVEYPQQSYRPQSQHFRLRTVVSNTSSVPAAARLPDTALVPNLACLPEAEMAALPHSTPEEVSDGNDSMSAPSEYLAEFLSAIMSRNYAEALKYCRLILHYEPNNTTAHGFYPLLKYKLGLSNSPVPHDTTNDGKVVGSSNSEDSSGEAGAVDRSGTSPEGLEDVDKDSDSEAESLSLDSSGSRSPSPAARDTDSSESECSPEMLGVTDVTAVGATWLADANGNPRTDSKKHTKHNRYSEDEDDENDNGGPNGDHRLVLQETDIRQLRAQFACSIK